MKYFIWLMRILAAVIMLQTLFFKFTGAEESVKLFKILGVEPYGRIGLGVLELIASILILLPSTYIIGAILTVGLMSGAVLTHLFLIGIKFNGDYILFAYAVIALVAAAIVLLQQREKLFQFIRSGFKWKNLMGLFLVTVSLNSFGQSKGIHPTTKELDFTTTIGAKQGSFALSYNHLYAVSKKKRNGSLDMD